MSRVLSSSRQPNESWILFCGFVVNALFLNFAGLCCIWCFTVVLNFAGLCCIWSFTVVLNFAGLCCIWCFTVVQMNTAISTWSRWSSLAGSRRWSRPSWMSWRGPGTASPTQGPTYSHGAPPTTVTGPILFPGTQGVGVKKINHIS